MINDVLCHSAWSVLSRLYFSFLILANLVVLYIIYDSETVVVLNISNCLLYLVISLIFVFSAAILFFVAVELPIRKLLRLWMREKKAAAVVNLNSTVSFSDIYENSREVDVSLGNKTEEDIIQDVIKYVP